MRISNVRVLLLSAPIPPGRRWTSDFGTNTKQDIAFVIVETDDGLSGYGEARGTPVVIKVLVEDVLGPQLVGEDPTESSSSGRRCTAPHACSLRCPTGVRITARAVGARRSMQSAASTSRSGISAARAWACQSTEC
jgi:L-alanine-DL-glutamate epimerase-like enolase superfamily enzyme